MPRKPRSSKKTSPPSPAAPMVAVGLCRCSTDRQDRSIGEQEAAIRAWTKSQRRRLLKVFKDEGVSGLNLSRPGLNACLEFLAKSQQKGTVVLFDRFARSTRHLVTALEECHSLGVDFISHQEALDTSTPMGAAMFTIISAMAQLEVDILRERTRAGMASARRRGKQIGGRRLPLDAQRVRELVAEKGVRGAGRELGVSPGTVLNVLRRAAQGSTAQEASALSRDEPAQPARE